MAGNIIKIFIFKTLANNNNLHAVTWQNWIWILPNFKSQVASYQITFFISCIIRQLSIPCHNVFGHKSVKKKWRSSSGLLFDWVVKIKKLILTRCFEEINLMCSLSPFDTENLTPCSRSSCALSALLTSRPLLSLLRGRGLPQKKSNQWSTTPREAALPCPQAVPLPCP